MHFHMSYCVLFTFFFHIKRNIKHAMCECGFNASSQMSIMKYILGKQVGFVKEDGSVNCCNAEDSVIKQKPVGQNEKL